jgi:hypothetical protein
MEYIYGTGLLFAAFVLVAVGRLVLSRPGASMSIDDFGVAETIALLFTGLVAFGVTEIATTVLRDWSLTSTLEMAAALGVLAVASVALWGVLSRMFPREPAASTDERPIDPSAPDGNRRGRPTTTSARGGARGRIKRAA